MIFWSGRSCCCVKKYKFRKLIKDFVLFLETTGCSSELTVKRKQETNQFNFEKVKLSSEINFSFETNSRNIEENSFNCGKTSVHTSKLHLLKVFELYTYNCIIAWLIEIELIDKMGLCFFSPCCIKFNMAQ